MSDLVIRRAVGGYLSHVVREDGRALCGFRPGARKTRRHHGKQSVRFGWTTGRAHYPCEACREALPK